MSASQEILIDSTPGGSADKDPRTFQRSLGFLFVRFVNCDADTRDLVTMRLE